MNTEKMRFLNHYRMILRKEAEKLFQLPVYVRMAFSDEVNSEVLFQVFVPTKDEETEGIDAARTTELLGIINSIGTWDLPNPQTVTVEKVSSLKHPRIR